VIVEESDRLNRFVEGLSTTDRAQAAQPIHLRAVRLEDLVRAALVRAENITRDHEIAVALDTALPEVSVEPASIVEVIYILLDNASKYAPVGTHITVRAGLSDEHHVQVTVSDHGPGIPPELRERVFERFFRVPGRESHDRRRRGIGLGLPIARRLVEAQAGRIWIDSPPPGGGTSVAMALPIALQNQEADKYAALAAAR
jgi:signal transduction histidine kinase